MKNKAGFIAQQSDAMKIENIFYYLLSSVIWVNISGL